jgi:hypothetical protein
MEERWNENEFVGVGSDFLILEEYTQKESDNV